MIGDGERENRRVGERKLYSRYDTCDNYLKSTKGSPDNLIHTTLHLN